MWDQTTIKLTALALAFAVVSVAQAAGESKALYRWVDENGQVHYGDKVQPSEAKRGREAIKNGVVTKVIPRELSGAELEQAQARIAAEKAAEEARQQRIARDRYLVQSFSSVADLQAAREERLAALDARAVLAQTAVTENEKTLADLRARTVSKAGEAALKKQIQSFESSLIENIQSVRKLREERALTETRYTADIERFKALRAGTIRFGD